MRSRRFAVTGAIVAAALVPAGMVVATAPPSSPPDTDAAATAPADTGDTATAPVDTGDTGTAPAGTSAESMPAGTEPAGTADAAATLVTIFNEDRQPVAEVTVAASEPNWSDYGEDDAPDEGRQYYRMTVEVRSLTTDDDEFGISVGDFILQDTHGFVDEADNVRTAAQAEADEDATEDADLASGEAVTLDLTFEHDAAADPHAVFYRVGDPDRLVLVGEATA